MSQTQKKAEVPHWRKKERGRGLDEGCTGREETLVLGLVEILREKNKFVRETRTRTHGPIPARSNQ